MTFQPNVRVIELSEDDFVSNTGSPPGTIRGKYYPSTGKILLNQELWCIKTFIHETMHALSIFSVRGDLALPYNDLIEGLTEFFTGCYLEQYHTACYTNCWRKQEENRCHHSYQIPLKIWSGFSRYISIKETAKIFFWDNNRNWELKWQNFITHINQTGYPKFHNIVGQRVLPNWLAFHLECKRSFNKEYERIYSSIDKTLDLCGVIK